MSDSLERLTNERDLLQREVQVLLEMNKTITEMAQGLCETITLLLNQIREHERTIELYQSFNPN